MHKKSRVFIPAIRYIEYPEDTDKEEPGQIEYLIIDRYFKGLSNGRSSPNIWSGGKLSKHIKSFINYSEKEIKRQQEFETFLAKDVLGVSKVELSYDQDLNQIKISVNGIERPIHQYGDGLSHLIILTYLSYTQGLGVFFIDEPEVGLHPGLQQAFMKALKPLRTEIAQQYFIVTHSNHFLDQQILDDDIAVFRFRSLNSGVCEIKKVDWGDQLLIQDLGVRPSASFLVNATIWVEGITDRLFLGHLIKLAIDEDSNMNAYTEGVHYSFVEYGGANLPHWSFLDHDEQQINVETLCGNGLLVIDTDASHWKDKRRRRLQKRLKDRLLVTCGRELENMVSGKILDKFSICLGSTGNVISRRKEFRNQPLGSYMEDTYKLTGLRTDSGTLKTLNKKKLLKVVRETELLSEFPSEVQKFARHLLTFINSYN